MVERAADNRNSVKTDIYTYYILFPKTFQLDKDFRFLLLIYKFYWDMMVVSLTGIISHF